MRRRPVIAAVILLALAGCGRPTVDTTYGRNRSTSVNGTGAFAGLFRAAGHEVRTAYVLTDALKDWADVIVRFAPRPGPVAKDEADWYDQWLESGADRRLVYVPREYDAAPEYWTRALDGLPKGAPARLRERIVAARTEANGWSSQLPPHAHQLASADHWFWVEAGQATAVCRALSGPWAAGVDPIKASLTRREPIKSNGGEVLLEGDGKPLVVALDRDDGSILVVEGGTFLLNLPLVEPARWPLAKRTVGWACDDNDDVIGPIGRRPRRVAFVEGGFVTAGEAQSRSAFDLLYVAPMGRVAAQLFALGLVACLARAPRLGRPRPPEPSGADRPVAHPEALGALLASTGQSREARSILDAYRRWRHVGQAARREPPKASDETRLNH